MQVKLNIRPQLAACPSGSVFDQLNMEPQSGQGKIVGRNTSQPMNVQWYYQETINNWQPITEFGFRLKKTGEPNEPIYVGLATDDQVQNHYDDPTQWEAYGVINASDLVAQDTYYWIEIEGFSIPIKKLNIIATSSQSYINGQPNWAIGITDLPSYTPGTFNIMTNIYPVGTWNEITNKDLMFYTCSESPPWGQLTDYYCEPATLPPGGGSVTAYSTGKNMGAEDGEFVLAIQSTYIPGGTVFSDPVILGPWDTMSFNTLIENITTSETVWFYMWYWNGTGWDLHDEASFDVIVEPFVCIADIIENQSTFYTGPFQPGELVVLAEVAVKNIGDAMEHIYGQPFFYPGEPNETGGTKSLKYDIAPGETWIYHPVVIIPSDPTNPLPVGIKVWCENESEPDWNSLGTKKFKVKL